MINFKRKTPTKQKENLCQALCRDGTPCLNSAEQDGYCWLHYQKKKKLNDSELKE